MSAKQRFLHSAFLILALLLGQAAMAAGGPNSAPLDQADYRAVTQSLQLQCQGADGRYSAAACRAGPVLSPEGTIGNGSAMINSPFASTDCISTAVVFDVVFTWGEADGAGGADRMFVVVFDDGTIEFSGFIDVPPSGLAGRVEFSYPDPNVGAGAPGIGLYIFTRQPFDAGTMNELARVDPLLVDEETNCTSLAPIVTLEASANEVAAGQPVTLTWNAQRTIGNFPCVTFDGPNTTWTENNLRGPVGVQTLNMPMQTGPVSFGMQCQGANGLLGVDTVTVNVVSGGTAPQVFLDANPGQTSPGSVLTLEWSSNAPLSGLPCLPGGGSGTSWAQLGALPANGRRSFTAPRTPGIFEFSLECSAGSLSGLDSAQVLIAASRPPPRPVQAGATSLTANGTTAAGTSNRPSVTRDGSALVFETSAANIAAILPNGQPHTDGNGANDIFLITSASAVTGSESLAKGGPPQAVLCSIDENGPLAVATMNPRVAATGAGATFEGGDGQVRTFEGGLGRTRGLTSSSAAGVAGNGPSANPDISQDAGRVVFDSSANNLVPTDGNTFMDVFMKNPASGEVEMISVGTGGAPANGPSTNPSISGDGNTVFFQTEATNIDGLPLAAPGRRAKGGISQICGSTGSPGLGRTRGCASVNPVTGQAGNGASRNVRMNQSGEFGVFESDATNLVGDDTNGVTDIYWFAWNGSQATGIVRVSVGPNGEQANGPSRMPSISDDGFTVTFESDATNLVTPDGNGQTDAFIKYVQSGQIQRFATTSTGGEPNGPSNQVGISGDGSMVVFSSGANNIVPGDANNRADVFVAPNPQVVDANEPGLQRATLPTPNPPNANCPGGFFIARVDDGPGIGVSPGIFGMELLLDDPGTRILAGGLNFGGLIDVSQVGFAGANIANPANENQLLNLSVTGNPTADPSSNLPVRITINRRTGDNIVQVFSTSAQINGTTPFTASVEVTPGYYETLVAAEGFPGSAAGGAPEGQFFFSLTTQFVNRLGGGFQGGAVVGGYHAANPFGGVSGFASFCIATPHSTTTRVFAAPTYGAAGAGDLRLQLLDAQQQVVYSVP